MFSEELKIKTEFADGGKNQSFGMKKRITDSRKSKRIKILTVTKYVSSALNGGEQALFQFLDFNRGNVKEILQTQLTH